MGVRFSIFSTYTLWHANSLALPTCRDPLFTRVRQDVLNLMNHPLQLQLATSELPLGSFRRLCRDRAVILEGLQYAAPAGLLDEEVIRHHTDVSSWLAAAEASGKSINAEAGISCFTCGGNHLNIDCPHDIEPNPSALALRSVLQQSGSVGAAAVLRSYSYACDRLLAVSPGTSCYSGWLTTHANRWVKLARACEAEYDDNNNNERLYKTTLSMFYNLLDGEASTAGLSASSACTILRESLEEIEPGYAISRDKHVSFVADLNGKSATKAQADIAKKKVDAAAAYIAAKRKKGKDGAF